MEMTAAYARALTHESEEIHINDFIEELEEEIIEEASKGQYKISYSIDNLRRLLHGEKDKEYRVKKFREKIADYFTKKGFTVILCEDKSTSGFTKFNRLDWIVWE